MKAMDKLLNILKLNDGEDDEYFDDEDDDYVDDEEETKKEKILPMRQSEVAEEPKKTVSKPIPLRQQQAKKTSASSNTEGIKFIKPVNIDDAYEITDELLANKTIVLNLEGLETTVAQRILDYSAGSCYTIRGKFEKVSECIYLIAPATVEISGSYNGSSVNLTDAAFSISGI